jgi:ethanolamine utilization microcompartment shell protein EutL
LEPDFRDLGVVTADRDDVQSTALVPARMTAAIEPLLLLC